MGGVGALAGSRLILEEDMRSAWEPLSCQTPLIVLTEHVAAMKTLDGKTPTPGLPTQALPTVPLQEMGAAPPQQSNEAEGVSCRKLPDATVYSRLLNFCSCG